MARHKALTVETVREFVAQRCNAREISAYARVNLRVAFAWIRHAAKAHGDELARHGTRRPAGRQKRMRRTTS
jgi:hypothetical protein